MTEGDHSRADPSRAEVMAFLSTPEGRRLIAEAHAAVSAYPDLIAAMTALRRREPNAHPALLAAAMTQVELRQRHGERLGPDATELLLTVDGAQQSTRWIVAQHRAERLRHAGVTAVADLGCGLGVDLRAMTESGLRAIGVERDPATAIAAAANAPTARVITGDCTDPAVLAEVLAGSDAVFLDPARRNPSGPRDALGGRVRPERDPALWSPPWPWVVALADRVPRLVAKVAPGMPASHAPAGSEIEWVSVDGDLVEACVWFPRLASGASRRATVITGDTVTTLTAQPADALVSDVGCDAPPAPTPTPTPMPGDLILEPDPAVIRADLVDVLRLHTTSQRIPGTDLLLQVESDMSHDTALATAYRIIDIVPARDRDLRSHLEREGCADLVLKARGLRLDAAAFTARARPRNASGPRATVILLPGPDGRARGYRVEPWASAAIRAT